MLRLLALSLLVVACSAPADPEGAESSAGELLTSAGDEALDPNDPPTNPDPHDPVMRPPSCPDLVHRSPLLGPKGLTFVIHVSKHADEAERELAHLQEIAPYLRARDVFMVEHESPVQDRLQAAFPCNSVHILAYPDEMEAALGTSRRIDGVAVDWEGANVDGHNQAYTVDALAGFAKKIRAHGKEPGFVPVLPPAFDDGDVTTHSGMQYEIVQIQGRCQTSPEAFAAGARSRLADFRAKNNPLRNMGVEISLDSVEAAGNHVGPERAADCTRAAFGKGARVIYLYGNSNDHLAAYFERLHDLGIRHRGG